MKVMHLLNTGKYSGAENVVCQIVDLMKDDVDFVYCSLDGEIKKVLADKDIMFVPLKKMSVFEVRRVIEEQKPDVVHAHDMRASFFAAMACGKTPLVCHIHNNAYDSRKMNLKSALFYLAAMKAKHVFWVSETSFSGYRFHSSFENKSSILLNVINVEKLYEKMREDKLSYHYDVVFVGRLTYQKNPERLINVLRVLCERNPSMKACIIGDGDLKEVVSSLIVKNHLESHIDLVGFKSNPLKMIHDSKVMLLVSRWEGLPMCVLEALALGVPVVSTPTDGIESIVVNGKNGFVCETDENLVDKIGDVIENAELQKSLSGESVRFSLYHNDKVSYSKKIMNVYVSAVKRRL